MPPKDPDQASSEKTNPPEPPKGEVNPPRPSEDDVTKERYAQLTPADKVAFHQAKLAYAQAYAQYDAAEAAAKITFGKPFQDFKAARTAYDRAADDVGEAIHKAEDALNKIAALAGNEKPAFKGTDQIPPLPEKLQPSGLTSPEKAKAQLEQLQAAVDDYKKAADGVAAAVAARQKAQAVLAPLAEPANLAEPNKAAQALAKQQYALELAQAQVALETAYDTYIVKIAEIVGHLPHSGQAMAATATIAKAAA